MNWINAHRPLSLGIACALGFALLATIIMSRGALPYDDAVLLWLNAHSSPALDSFFVATTHLGGVISVAAATAIVMILAFVYRRKKAAAFIAFAVGGAALLHLVFKALFERLRPDLWDVLLVTETSYSFPSGHATASMALALSVVLLAWHTKWRMYALLIAVPYVALVGLSRLYLGVHFPSDIVGGWLLTGATVLLLWVWFRPLHKKVRT